ncbi:TonB-dependent receptor [Streptobacillus moniliformis]|uniref:TonB-dependent receptor n=1 Tax=Streptobacillus moniliformis TaxID=34105 RepID=UPI0007E41C39|nr:TonB-dependent receptor [Streptobacillus moniliformis]
MKYIINHKNIMCLLLLPLITYSHESNINGDIAFGITSELNSSIPLKLDLLKNMKLRKSLSFKLKEKYLGLGLEVDILGKNISYTDFLGNNDIESLKLKLISDSKYINGEINYYIKNESSDVKNKALEYKVSINPTADNKVSLSLDILGKNKDIIIGLTFRYRNMGTYIDTSVLLNNIKTAYDITDEIKQSDHVKDIDLKNNKSKHSIKIKIEAGHLGENYKLGTSLLLNDRVEVQGDKYRYIKRANHFGIYSEYKDLLEFSNKSDLSIAKNTLNKTENNQNHTYNNISLNTDTYLGLNIPANEKLNVLLGLRHIGMYSWVNTNNSGFVYDMNNILTPRINVIYKPYKNIEFSNNLELPLSIKGRSIYGIRSIYIGEIKYLIDDSFKDVLETKEFPIKFKSSGNIETGIILKKKPTHYLSYKAMADIGFLRGDIKGNNRNIDFSLSLNPLVINFPIKPRVMFIRENSDLSIKFGLEYSKSEEFSSLVGFKKAVRLGNDIIEDELKPNILKVLKYNSYDKYNEIDEKLKEITFNAKLNHIFTPFLNIRKDSDNFKVNIKAESSKITGHDEKSKIEIGDFKDRVAKEYIAWNNQENNGLNWLSFGAIRKYNYFIDVKSDKVTKETKTMVDLDNQKYDFVIFTEYGKDKGFNFNMNLGLSYNEINLKYKKEIDIKTETKSRVVNIVSDIGRLTLTDELINKGSNVELTEGKLLESLKNHVKKNNAKDEFIYSLEYEVFGLLYKQVTEEYLKNKLDYPISIKEEKKEENNVFLSKRINLNLDTYLGYNFNPIDKMIVSVGSKYSMYLRYDLIDKIKKDNKELGYKKILIGNTITPEVKMTYDLINNFSVMVGTGIPIYIENKRFKSIRFNIRTGIEYKW